MSKLRIAENLSLPEDAVTQTFVILAKRGVGKTLAASVMAEEMLKIGQPIVVYDPTGAWWGLKSSKNGKAAGYRLQAALEVYPKALSREAAAERAGYEASGGGFNNALSRLRTLELIQGRGEIRASENLFDERQGARG
jgi:DNA helicase HerA-like ATPase